MGGVYDAGPLAAGFGVRRLAGALPYVSVGRRGQATAKRCQATASLKALVNRVVVCFVS